MGGVVIVMSGLMLMIERLELRFGVMGDFESLDENGTIGGI